MYSLIRIRCWEVKCVLGLSKFSVSYVLEEGVTSNYFFVGEQKDKKLRAGISAA